MLVTYSNFLKQLGKLECYLLSLEFSIVRLAVRTPPFHGGNTGSNPVRCINLEWYPNYI